MLAYAGKGPLVVSTIQLASLVKEMSSLVPGLHLPERAILSSIRRDEPVIEADVTQLRQIVLNLVINASDAIGDQNGAMSNLDRRR